MQACEKLHKVYGDEALKECQYWFVRFCSGDYNVIPIWWDCKGVVFFEFLSRNVTLNSDVYCQQLDKLNEAIAEKRPELINRKEVIFHHDNARSHSSLMTREKLLELGWMCCLIRHIRLILRHQTIICFDPYKTS